MGQIPQDILYIMGGANVQVIQYKLVMIHKDQGKASKRRFYIEILLALYIILNGEPLQ